MRASMHACDNTTRCTRQRLIDAKTFIAAACCCSLQHAPAPWLHSRFASA
jgi:hypothetical protein